MERYGDLDKLLEHIKDLPTWWADSGGVFGKAMKYPDGMFDCDDVINSIENTPTADVVEVVRCSECDHFLECGEEGYCIIMMRGTLKYGFCSSAVRKEKT
jgi:hypothetical protein